MEGLDRIGGLLSEMLLEGGGGADSGTEGINSPPKLDADVQFRLQQTMRDLARQNASATAIPLADNPAEISTQPMVTKTSKHTVTSPVTKAFKHTACSFCFIALLFLVAAEAGW